MSHERKVAIKLCNFISSQDGGRRKKRSSSGNGWREFSMWSSCVYIYCTVRRREKRANEKMHTVNYYVILHYIRLEGNVVGNKSPPRRHEDIFILHKNCFKSLSSSTPKEKFRKCDLIQYSPVLCFFSFQHHSFHFIFFSQKCPLVFSPENNFLLSFFFFFTN